MVIVIFFIEYELGFNLVLYFINKFFLGFVYMILNFWLGKKIFVLI